MEFKPARVRRVRFSRTRNCKSTRRAAWISKKIASKVEDRDIVPELHSAVKKLHELTLQVKDTVDNPLANPGFKHSGVVIAPRSG